MIGQGRPTISAVVAAIVWLAGASWLAAQETAAPVDSLRIIAHRDPLIFAPGEQFTFDLEPLLAGVEPSTTIDIAASLTRARGRETRWSSQQRLPVPFDGPAIATLHVPLPREEGVYEIRLEVTRPPGFRERWFPGGAGAPIVERSFQVVVLDRVPKPAAPDAEWKRVLEIDPANRAWSTRLPDWTQIRRIPGVSRRPLGSVQTSPVKTPLGEFVELPATPPNGEPHWQAYPLQLDSASGPHLLEVEYPNDREQHLGISIVEPDSAGRFVTIGRDSGVYVEGLGSAENVARQKHRIVFWPHTKSPLVLITNQHTTAAGRFGHIRVMKRTASTLAVEPWPTTPHAGRLVAAYLADPVRGDRMQQPADAAASTLYIDDWLTMYDGATQLAEYLNYAGYNAVAVNVMADGGYLIPPKLLHAQSHHDIGPIAAGSDLPTADGLELMLRVFDRVGMSVIPTIEFTAPIPALESLRQRVDPRSGGIELVGPGGLTWLEAHPSEQGLPLRYNLLDPRVQQAALDVADEILQRYGRHPALRSLAVQLSSRGYGVLPGLEWGFDDTTVGRFEQETGVRIGADGPDRFDVRQSQLTGKYFELWRGWRAEQVTRFYQQLAKRVAASGGSRQLVLTTERLFDRTEAADKLRPNVIAKPRLERAMLDMGVDWPALCSTPGIAPLPTRYVESMNPLVDRALDLSITSAFEAIAERPSAALFYHRPRRQKFASLDALNPFAANAPLLTQSAGHDAAMRRPYIAALAADDPSIIFDGGDVLPLGQEEAVRGLRAILRALPESGAVDVQRENNVMVRTYEDRGQTVCLVVNQCPWNAEVALDVVSNAATTAIPLVIGRDDASHAATEQFAAGHQIWSLRLAPYDVRAVRFSGASPKIERIESRISETGRQELAARVNELKNRDLTAMPRYAKLANPSFEPLGGGVNAPVPGWQFVGDAATAQAQLDATMPQESQTCLYMKNSGPGVASIASDEFAVPPTGQLGMLAFIRGMNVGPNTLVRLVFEIEDGPKKYRRHSVLGGNRPDAIPIAAAWGGGYAFGQDDLPLDSQARMRIKFELVGPGEIWIDNVQLYNLLFPLSFYNSGGKERLELVKLQTEADSELKRGQFADCARTLEGYWPRFVNSYRPTVAPAIANQPPPQEGSPPAGAQSPPAETPSVGSRWFNFWKK